MGQAFRPRYRIIKMLGIGGMGAVYQPWDAELGVAAILLRLPVQDDGNERRRFFPSSD